MSDILRLVRTEDARVIECPDGFKHAQFSHPILFPGGENHYIMVPQLSGAKDGDVIQVGVYERVHEEDSE